MNTADDPAAELWDVVVVGTGMGGATLGHSLAGAGHKVLFLEKGHDELPTPQPVGVQFEDIDSRLDAAHWPARIRTRVDDRSSEVFASLGYGSRGSSTLYAATLEWLALAHPGAPLRAGGGRVSQPRVAAGVVE